MMLMDIGGMDGLNVVGANPVFRGFSELDLIFDLHVREEQNLFEKAASSSTR